MKIARIRAVLDAIPDACWATERYVDADFARRDATGHLLVAAHVPVSLLYINQPAHPEGVYSEAFRALIDDVLRREYGIDGIGQLELEQANDGLFEWAHLRWTTTPKQRVMQLLSGRQLPWDVFPSEWVEDEEPVELAEPGAP